MTYEEKKQLKEALTRLDSATEHVTPRRAWVSAKKDKHKGPVRYILTEENFISVTSILQAMYEAPASR